MNPGLRLILLLGQRPGEVAGMRPEDVRGGILAHARTGHRKMEGY